MPTVESPPFGQSSGQNTTYTDNTLYALSTSGAAVPLGYPWQFAAAAQAAGRGVFPSPLQQSHPVNYHFRMYGNGAQGATLNNMQCSLLVYGVSFGINIPTTAFVASAPFILRARADIGLLPTGQLYASMEVIVSQFGGNSTVNFSSCNANGGIVGPAVIQNAGTIGWVGTFGGVTTAPTYTTSYNMITIENPTR